MDKDIYKIDGEKIDFHQERIKQWLEAEKDWEKAKKVYPIYIEFSPAGACNHRCTFCAVDYIGYKTRFLETNTLKERLTEMGELGVRSIMYAGEGEPLLHKDLAEIIVHTKESGIDVAITTNATPMSEKFLRQSLPSITWIKASINSGRAETYAQIHKTKAEHFHAAWRNMALASRIRKEKSLNP